MPSVRRAAAWVTATFFVASMVTATTGLYLLTLTMRSSSGVADFAFQLQTMHM